MKKQLKLPQQAVTQCGATPKLPTLDQPVPSCEGDNLKMTATICINKI